jgi:hypothetical protein
LSSAELTCDIWTEDGGLKRSVIRAPLDRIRSRGVTRKSNAFLFIPNTPLIILARIEIIELPSAFQNVQFQSVTHQNCLNAELAFAILSTSSGQRGRRKTHSRGERKPRLPPLSNFPVETR